MGKPDSVDDLYPRKWLVATDLNGRTATVKIAAVNVETFYIPKRNEENTAAVLSFEGKQRRMILNKTQCRALAAITKSSKFADWIGKAVRLAQGVAPNGKPTILISAAEPVTAASNGNGQQEMQGHGVGAHWYHDPEQRKSFELAVGELGYGDQQVAEALGVEKPELFTGTLEQALDALNAYASELAKATQEQSQ